MSKGSFSCPHRPCDSRFW